MKIKKKHIALLMSILMCIEMIPLQVFADSMPADSEVAEETMDELEEAEASLEMLDEIEDFRESDVKHFQNTNGSFTAVKYSQPVHFQKETDGKWKDIDNRMKLVNAEEAPGVERIHQAGSEAFGSDTREVYIPQDSPIDAVFAKNSDAQYIAAINNEGYTLAWRYAIEGNDINTEELLKSEASELKQEENNEEEKQYSAVRNVFGGLVYQDIAESIDLEYILDSVNLKENLVLKERNAASSFLIKYDVGDLKAVQVSEHEIMQICKKSIKTVYNSSFNYISC